MSARSAISFGQLGIDRVFLTALLWILPRLKSRECGGQIIQHFHYSPLPIQLLRYCLYFPLWFFLFHSSYLTVYPPEQGGRCWCYIGGNNHIPAVAFLLLFGIPVFCIIIAEKLLSNVFNNSFVKNPKIIRIKISYASWTAPILNF